MLAMLLPGESLTAVLAGAVSATQPTYSTIVKQGGRPEEKNGSLNSATAVTITVVPATGETEVVSLNLYNGDSAAVVVTIKKVSGSNSYTLFSGTLQSGDTLRFDPGKGWHVVDSSGMARITRTGYQIQVGTRAKVGGTAGWVVAAATDLPYVATMAASQTAGTLVIPIDGLHIGDTITAFTITAQVESGGNAVTIDAALRAVTNVAAEPTDASIGAITQVSVTADTAVSASKTGLAEVVAAGKNYYLLITATTLGSTDIILLNPVVTVTQG